METQTNLLQKLSQAGTHPNNSNYLNRKISITNRLAWMQTLLSFTYMVSVWGNMPAIFGLTVGSFTLYVLVLWLNWIRFHLIARILMVLVPVTEGIVYHGVLVGAGDPLNTVLYLNFLIACIYPFVVFGLRERWILILTAMIGGIAFVGFPYYMDLIPKLLTDQEIQQNQNTELSVYFMVLGVLYIIMTVKVLDGYQATKLHSELRQKTEMQNEEMIKSQNRLNEILRELEQKQQEEKQRSQVSHWLTQINDILNSSSGEQDVYHRLISQIVEALSVNQGGLYSVNYESPDDKYIELVASYAYQRQKFETQQRIQLGEGLLGQSYLEKENVILTDIPQNYTKIASGLGDATPNFLAIIPLKINDNIEGFVEVASFEELSDYQIEFLERAGESMASFMTSEKVQKRTQKLLEQSQIQAEELRLKEEEMRQNMEELQATQEKVQRKEQDYIQQIEALKKEIQTHTK